MHFDAAIVSGIATTWHWHKPQLSVIWPGNEDCLILNWYLQDSYHQSGKPKRYYQLAVFHTGVLLTFCPHSFIANLWLSHPSVSPANMSAPASSAGSLLCTLLSSGKSGPLMASSCSCCCPTAPGFSSRAGLSTLGVLCGLPLLCVWKNASSLLTLALSLHICRRCLFPDNTF